MVVRSFDSRLLYYSKKYACIYFNVKHAEIISDSQKREITDARFVVMSIMISYSTYTVDAIAQEFNKNHASVLHAFQEVRKLYDTNKPFKNRLNGVLKALNKVLKTSFCFETLLTRTEQVEMKRRNEMLYVVTKEREDIYNQLLNDLSNENTLQLAEKLREAELNVYNQLILINQ